METALIGEGSDDQRTVPQIEIQDSLPLPGADVRRWSVPGLSQSVQDAVRARLAEMSELGRASSSQAASVMRLWNRFCDSPAAGVVVVALWCIGIMVFLDQILIEIFG